jgi:hypothetical protein
LSEERRAGRQATHAWDHASDGRLRQGAENYDKYGLMICKMIKDHDKETLRH